MQAEAKSKPQHEVIIVGGGISGLTAAWLLRDRDICVLEADERIGGRLKTETREPYWLNLGAHVLKDGGSMASLAQEAGVPLVEPQGQFVAVAMKGRLIQAGSAEAMLLRLPFSPAARVSLAQVGLRLRAAEMRAGLNGHGTLDSLPATVRAAREAMEQTTFAEVLGPMHPEVHDLLRVIANRVGGELHQLSGLAGVGGFHHLWRAMRTNIRGGSARLPQALHQALGARVQTGARVTRVEQFADRVEVDFISGGETRRATAETCIVAVPAPLAPELIRSLPPALDTALKQMRYTPFLVAGIFTKETSPMPWDDLYALVVPGRSFAMFFNPANALRGPGPRQPGGSLVVYAVAERATQLMQLSDSEIRDRYLSDLYEIFPQARGIVSEVVIQRWPVAVAQAFPGRAAAQKQLVEPWGWGRIVLAGDYTLPLEGVDASETGRHAAEAIKHRLTQAKEPR